MNSITILGGRDKEGRAEELDFTCKRGEIVCIVGPTGAGKSRFLEDIECFAQGDTPTGRRVLVDGAAPPEETRFESEKKLVSCLSQNMNFVMDLSVREFLAMHAEARGIQAGGVEDDSFIRRIAAAANALTGEAFELDTPVTRLSGGQSRALMIADTAMLSPSPVVLIDELENAGVDREAALNLLVSGEKIIIISTHDPAIALLGGRRLCIRGGAVRGVFTTGEAERANAKIIAALNGRLLELRRLLREGKTLDFNMEDFFSEH
ncbi:MAG: ATP-binding cassette domain-containing protein [Spirochaetaceae bacterium]|jgi:ABC-type lipoprotein export system ATPase subunit|nr:ATP-binding cassette domain-containing protein [Spirochaetaceae bacterium]